MKVNTIKTFIIAEAGVNHNGSLKKALKALDNRKDQKIIISGIINKIH